MSDEDKCDVLTETRDSLLSIIKDLNNNKKEFKNYIDCISEIITEMNGEIEILEEEQNHNWAEEMKQANRDFESMRI